MFRRATEFVHRFLPEGLSLSPVLVTLDTGIKACIDSESSLQMFVELFITRPYASALDLAHNVEFGIDLGANRGFFLLFALHHLRKHGRGETPRFVCVEAAEPNFRRLKHHIEMNGLIESIVPVLGAVCGRRSGEVDFYYAPRFHAMARIVDGRRLTTRRVPVVDLAKCVGGREVDVLKIDIEGAEQGFLEEYGEILERTQVVVGEFHLREVNYEHCQALLRERGLLFNHRTFQFKDILCVDVYTRGAGSS